MTMKTYLKMLEFPSFHDRFMYLRFTDTSIGIETFGSLRYLNQEFYRSEQWKRVRNYVIARDNGMDLAHRNSPISGQILVHHIEPILPEYFASGSPLLLDPNNLVSTSLTTHRGIHYGLEPLLHSSVTIRRPNDTKLW